MIERKANTYRLYPTPEQSAQMAQFAGACRFVFNLALEQRSEWNRPGRNFNFASQCREVTQLRAEVDWLKASPVHTLQQALARKKRGSSNRRKAIRRVAKIQMRVANARKNFLHERTTDIAKNHGTVVIEALKMRNMYASAKGTAEKPGKKVAQKAGLNRAILDQGWGAFRVMLAYKLADRGATLVEVPAAYTSQTCAECGVVNARSRQSQSCFICTGCAHEANADTNAAIVILKRGTDSSLKPAEGHRAKRPDDAGSIRRAA